MGSEMCIRDSIYYLIEFDNKLVVMIQWAWNYITLGRGARLITGKTALYANSEGSASETRKNKTEKIEERELVKS